MHLLYNLNEIKPKMRSFVDMNIADIKYNFHNKKNHNEPLCEQQGRAKLLQYHTVFCCLLYYIRWEVFTLMPGEVHSKLVKQRGQSYQESLNKANHL